MAIKRVGTSKLVPGMVLGSDVITSIGQVLLSKGAVLTDTDITRFDFYSILSVNIEEPDEKTEEDSEASLSLEEERKLAESYLEQLKAKPQFQAYKIAFARSHRNFEEVLMDAVLEGQDLDKVRLLDMVDELVSSAREVAGVFDMLHNLRTYDDQVYAHSINVALICAAMADWFNLSKADKDTLVLSGLLHDIGKLKVSRELLNKKGELTDEELQFVHNHTTEGYSMILAQGGVNDHVRNAVLMHHERLDGSGYPLGLSAEQIDPFAKMVAIADVYEAVTSPRVYRPALCPFEAIRIFEEEGRSLYDPEFLSIFLENVLNTYLQNKVVLSNGEIGMVVMINKNHLCRPLVRTESAVYDLRKRRDLEILSIC